MFFGDSEETRLMLLREVLFIVISSGHLANLNQNFDHVSGTKLAVGLGFRADIINAG